MLLSAIENTLIPIIQKKFQAGSVIHSDEWPVYGCLNTLGYVNREINHQRNYVDSATGAHTQAVERSWLDAKIDILGKRGSIPSHMLQSDLNYFC